MITFPLQTRTNNIIIIIIIIENGRKCNAGKWRFKPYQSKDSSLTIPAHRYKEEKEKIVADQKGSEQPWPIKKIIIPGLKTR